MENRHNNQKNCTFATEILALSATMMFTMIVPELHYYHLGDGVTAFSTTRQGGYSQGNYGQFNINCYCGDDKEAIQKNREALCQLLAIADDHLLMPHQVHLTKIAQIDDAFFALPADERHQALEGVDALMTNIEGVCIGVSTADCIPVLLYDPVQRAACAIHAGWRGTVKRITEQAVAQMTAVYGTRPADIIAQIGPGIHLDSFEVGNEVYEAFQQEGFDMQAISKKKEKWHIDLPECNRLQLIAKGIPADHIAVSSTCTFQQADRFFSARRLGINSGRIFTSIILRQK